MSIFSVANWAKSSHGKPIHLHFGPGPKLQDLTRPVLIIGGVHGNETEGVVLAQHTLQWLRDNSNKAAIPWILIECLNPDGFEKRQRVNGNGVDLNRNYPSRNWSPEARAEKYYPGPFAKSESEVAAVVDLIEQTNPRLIIHCHSDDKPAIIRTGHLGQRDAEYLAKSSHYPIQDTIGYATPGSLSEFAWHDRGLPVICIEEFEGVDPSTIWPRFEKGVTQILLDPRSRTKKDS